MEGPETILENIVSGRNREGAFARRVRTTRAGRQFGPARASSRGGMADGRKIRTRSFHWRHCTITAFTH